MSHDQLPETTNVPHSGVGGREKPVTTFDNTSLQQAHDQGLLVTPDSPKGLEKPGFFQRHKKKIAGIAVANTLLGTAAFVGAKTLFTDKIEEALETPSVGAPVVPGETTETSQPTDTVETEAPTLNPEHGFVLYDDDPAMMDNFLINFMMDTATERYTTGISDIKDLENVVDIESNTGKNLDASIDVMVKHLQRVETAATKQGLDISDGLTAGITMEVVESVNDGQTLSATATHEYLAFTTTGEYIGHLYANLDTIKVTFEKRQLQDAEGNPVEVGVVTNREILQQ